MAISVVLADDHVIVRNGIKALLESEQGIAVIGEASDGEEALKVIEELQPDIVIMDIRMPVMNGIEATKEIPNYSEKTSSLILSMHDNEEYILQAIECGASGYLLKDTERSEFLKAIYEVAAGRKYYSSPVAAILAENYLNNQKKVYKQPFSSPFIRSEYFSLTDKEREILEKIVQGLSNKEIAERFDKSIRTVETQRFKLMKKLGVKNVVELVNLAKENNLIDQRHFEE